MHPLSTALPDVDQPGITDMYIARSIIPSRRLGHLWILILISVEALPTHHCMKSIKYYGSWTVLNYPLRCRQGCVVHSGTVVSWRLLRRANCRHARVWPRSQPLGLFMHLIYLHRLRGSASSQPSRPLVSGFHYTYRDHLEPPRRLGSIVARSESAPPRVLCRCRLQTWLKPSCQGPKTRQALTVAI